MNLWHRQKTTPPARLEMRIESLEGIALALLHQHERIQTAPSLVEAQSIARSALIGGHRRLWHLRPLP